MKPKIYRRFSFIGIIAIVAFFLPWVKACDTPESGFSLFILNAFDDFRLGSIGSIFDGLWFVLVPIYTIITAHFLNEEDTFKISKVVKYSFIFVCAVTLWAALTWLSLMFENATYMFKEYRMQSIASFFFFVLNTATTIFIILHLINWKRRGFHLFYSELVLLLSTIPILCWAFIEGTYYGLKIYLAVIVIRAIGAVYQIRRFTSS